ncbi:MAG: glycosyltransferase family 4 protein [Gaiellaceae bacterium]
MRVAFVYPNPRTRLAEDVRRGEAPDTGLLGQNHLAELGIDAFVYDSALRRVNSARGLSHRVSWLAREATLPWELRAVDLIVTPLATLLPLFARLRSRPRVLLLSYGTVALWRRSSAPRRALLRASLRAADAIVTISNAARDHIVDEIGIDEDRVRSLPFGIDDRFWRPEASAGDGHVLTVGRDLARDYRTFVEALDGLDTRAVIVAKDENLQGMSLPRNVEARTYIPVDELRALYAGARCVVVPMVPDGDPRGTESSGNTALLEAMACGRATIATERESLREYVYDDASTVIRSGDPGALRAAVERLVQSPGEAEAMGAAARAHVEDRHTSRQFAAHLAEVIRWLEHGS